MASSRFKPLEMLLRKYFDGSHMDSATRALAAKCITASGRMLESAVSIWFRSARSRLRSRAFARMRSEEHTSELQSRGHLVCRLLLEKKKKPIYHLTYR